MWCINRYGIMEMKDYCDIDSIDLLSDEKLNKA